jgi:proline iminopeptidase
MMQGPSEFGVSGRLTGWDRKAELKNIRIPTLMIGARYDTMDPKAMEEQSHLVQKGSYLFCPNGSHLAMYDDQEIYMKGVVDWLRKN